MIDLPFLADGHCSSFLVNVCIAVNDALAVFKHNWVDTKTGRPSCFFGGNLVYPLTALDSFQPKSPPGVPGFGETGFGLNTANV